MLQKKTDWIRKRTNSSLYRDVYVDKIVDSINHLHENAHLKRKRFKERSAQGCSSR